jgi:hypothetical protein
MQKPRYNPQMLLLTVMKIGERKVELECRSWVRVTPPLEFDSALRRWGGRTPYDFADRYMQGTMRLQVTKE